MAETLDPSVQPPPFPVPEGGRPYGVVLRHDLANRLQAVKMWVDLIARHPDSPPGQEKLGRLRHALARLESFVDQAACLVKYQSLSRLEVGEADLRALVGEAEAAVRPLLGAKGQSLRRHEGSCPSGDWTVRANRCLVEAFRQLLDNASRYSPDGALLAVELEGADPTFVVVVIRDTGPGIPDSLRPFLFDPVARRPMEACSRRDRPGLGLAIARRILELHGGDLTLVAPKEGGTRVVVRLPRRGPPTGCLPSGGGAGGASP